MTQSRFGIGTARLLGAGMMLALLVSILPLAGVSAATGVTAATGGSAISADTNSGTGTGVYTSLTGPAVTGTGSGDIANGTVILNFPAGFEFDNTSGSAASSGVGCSGLVAGAVSYNVAKTTATTTLSGGPSTGACAVTFTGLKVRPTTSTLNTGNITNTGSSGLAALTNYGTLTEVPGAPILSFAQAPVAGSSGGVAFSVGQQPIVHSQDQYGHSRSGDQIELTITPGTGTPGSNVSCSANPLVTLGTGNASFSGCFIDKAGTNYQLRAATLGATSVDSAPAFPITVGPPAILAFTSYPATTTTSNLTPTPTVAIEDAGGNLVNTATNTVTLASNQNVGNFNCTGGLSKAAVAGFAPFTCTETVAASGYTITASSPLLASAVGPLFSVTSGPASKLALCWGPALVCNTTPNATTTGGTAMTLQPEVRVQDALGNTVVSDSTTVVTIAIVAGTPTSGGPGTLTCTGGNTKTVTNGVADFTGCSIDKVGSNYQLVATSAPAFTSSTSTAFNVTAGPATKLAFLATPGITTAGAVFTTNPVVAIQDAGGNTVTTGIAATIALGIGTNPGGGTLSCTGGTSVTTVAGVATFTGCSINNAGVAYTLTATATAVVPVTTLASATSTAFTITAPGAVITVSASAPTITWGQTVVISVHFGVNGANKTFRLEGARDPNNVANFSLIANLTTNASGDVSFSYTPPTNLYYRAVFAGTPDLSPAISPLTRVVVRQIALLRPTNNGATRTVNAGTSILFTTTVRPSRPELTPAVVVYTVFQLKNGTWVQILARNVTATAVGIAQLSITFSTKGSFYVRSQANPTPYNANSVNSPVERYNVN